MGQAGAQREPSMEEILASIRRIIENNEPAPDGGQGGEPESATSHFDDGADADDQPATQSHNDETADANDEPAFAHPVSLAEVAALARSAPSAPAMVETAVHVNVADDDASTDDDAADELRDALVSDEPVEAMAAERISVAQPAVEYAAPVHEPVNEIASQPESEPATPEAKRVDDAPSAESRNESGGQLVSLHTGEKVAAAFSELDAAIAAGQQRSFDEIAEEMLRPMLTQWLDDNLPTLVERLVREEIERVSRGNRR